MIVFLDDYKKVMKIIKNTSEESNQKKMVSIENQSDCIAVAIKRRKSPALIKAIQRANERAW